jgi:hypothetical protein
MEKFMSLNVYYTRLILIGKQELIGDLGKSESSPRFLMDSRGLWGSLLYEVMFSCVR